MQYCALPFMLHPSFITFIECWVFQQSTCNTTRMYLIICRFSRNGQKKTWPQITNHLAGKSCSKIQHVKLWNKMQLWLAMLQHNTCSFVSIPRNIYWEQMVHLTLLTVAPEGILCCFRADKPVYIITEVQFVLIFL